MRINRALIALTLGLIFALGGLATNALRAQPAATLALTGKVTSVAEGAMEGVLVSAKRSDSTITGTVVESLRAITALETTWGCLFRTLAISSGSMRKPRILI